MARRSHVAFQNQSSSNTDREHRICQEKAFALHCILKSDRIVKPGVLLLPVVNEAPLLVLEFLGRTLSRLGDGSLPHSALARVRSTVGITVLFSSVQRFVVTAYVFTFF